MDSQFSGREAAAVKEWRYNSNFSIHSMRDHPYHTSPMLGSAWGTDLTRKVIGTNSTARQEWKLAWKNMLNDDLMYADRKDWGPDQTILTRYSCSIREFHRFTFFIVIN